MSTSTIPTYTRAGQRANRPDGSLSRRLAAWRDRALLRDCRGALLLETVIASMVFSMVGVAVLAGLSTAYMSGSKTEVQSVSENLARNQMEQIFSGAYREPEQTPYPTMDGIPTGYSISTEVVFADPSADYPDPEVELVTVTTWYDGREILTLQTLRGRTDGIQIRYSLEEDRTGSARLHGAAIGAGTSPPCECGVVYVFLDDPEGRVEGPVHFYLNGAFERTENYVYYDFKGSGGIDPSDPANPWDTEDPLLNGTYTILAEVKLVSGETVNVTAKFEISN